MPAPNTTMKVTNNKNTTTPPKILPIVEAPLLGLIASNKQPLVYIVKLFS
jgi:hypothetical protein